jgi:hypothetical protein
MPRPANVSMNDLGMVPGVGGMAVAGLVRDVGQRPAHLALDGVRGQERLGVHRVEVVDAVEQLVSDAPRAQCPG